MQPLIDLTTDYDPGSADTGGSYTHVGVSNLGFNQSQSRIDVAYEYGKVVEGAFVAGNAPKVTTPPIMGDDYTALEALLSSEDEPCLDAFLRALLQLAITKTWFAGTIA